MLFKILAGEEKPDEGSFKWGVTTSQGYFPKDNTKEFDNDLIIRLADTVFERKGLNLCHGIPWSYVISR